MRRRWLSLFGVLAAGCGAGAEAEPRRAPVIETTLARCDVAARPGYFVPGPEDGRLALLGCARLGVSGKRVEFSGQLEDIGGAREVCINPAYSGRGRRGMYIPSICALRPPPLSRFAVRDVARPRQGVRGYALVIWGTAGATATGVVARFTGGTARAAILAVPPELARSFGEPPFSLFVVELPVSAACAPIEVSARGSGATEWIRARRAPCGRG